MWTQLTHPCLCAPLQARSAGRSCSASAQTVTQQLRHSSLASLADCTLHRHGTSSPSVRCKADNGAASTAVADPEVSDAPQSAMLTGGMSDTTGGATNPFSDVHLDKPKHIIIVRHGQTTWNVAKRMQGDSTEAELTDLGKEQAQRVSAALSNIKFDSCFTSPIPRAQSFAALVWGDRPGKPQDMQSLKEAHLGWLQGMENAVALRDHPDVYHHWRDRPADFSIDGRSPVVEVFLEAKDVWEKVLKAEGSVHLLITHKSILRALLCVALRLGPASFRAIDAHNGSVSIFKVNTKGEPMMTNLNMTSHLQTPEVRY